MILYKYLPPERLDVLARRRIRFTQPLALNDPFELRPYFQTLLPDRYLIDQLAGKEIDITPQIVDAYEQLPEHLRRSMPLKDLLSLMKHIVESDEGKQHIQSFVVEAVAVMTNVFKQATPKFRGQLIQTLGSKVGILSLSESPDSTLMWSHYGGHHRGFLIGFDSSHPFFDRRRSKEDEFYHLRRVQYQHPNVDNSLLDLDGEKVFLAKLPVWSYEREWRILAPITDATEVIQREELIALFEFDATSIVEVVVGARSGERLPTEIESILNSDSQYSRAQLKYAVLDEVTGAISVASALTSS